MTSGYIGSPAGNTIIPITNLIQRTKWVDISSKLTITLNAGTPTTVRAYAMFYADSNGVWTMRYRISSSASSATKASAAFALAGITTVNVAGNYMPASAWIDSSTVIANTEGSVNSSTFIIVKHANADIRNYDVSGECELKQEPTWADVATGLTKASAIDNSQSVAAYIPSASATSAGLVDTVAQTFAGNKTFTGFTALGSGNVALKCKRFTGTTDSSQGGSASVAHGLDSSKIVSVQVLVALAAGSYLHAGYTHDPGFQFNFYNNTTNLVVYNNATNSSNILSKAFSALIWYIE